MYKKIYLKHFVMCTFVILKKVPMCLCCILQLKNMVEFLW